MKMPPIEKVYEAWSAIADGRVHLSEDETATIVSSDAAKTYTVKYDLAAGVYASDDNATFWRGYPGYPVLAVMMLLHVLPCDIDFAQLWGGVNWNALNAQYTRDYAAAVAHVEQERGIDPIMAAERAQIVMSVLEGLDIKVKRFKK